MIDILYGARNEIIGGLVVALLLWCANKFRVFTKIYKCKKQELERMTAEIQSKDEALSQSAAKIYELQEKLEREKARKKISPMSDSYFLEFCKSGDSEKVEQAIMSGADANAKDNNGRTAFMWAMLSYNTDIADLLRKYGAK